MKWNFKDFWNKVHLVGIFIQSYHNDVRNHEPETDTDSSDEDSGGQIFLHESEHSYPKSYICPHLPTDCDTALRYIIKIIIKFTYTMGKYFANLRLFFSKVLFISNTIFFSPVHEML